MKEETDIKTVLLVAQDDLDEYSRKVLEIKNYKDMPKMSVNPFRVMLNDSIKIAYRNNGSALLDRFEITDKDTGEVISDSKNNVLLRRKQYVDNKTFVKIYHDSLKDIFSLGSSAIKVFGYLMSEMQNTINSDFVYFDEKACERFCEWKSHPQVYEGLEELIRKLIICKTENMNKIWINPKFVFNGNRIVVFNEFIDKDNDHFKGKKGLKR